MISWERLRVFASVAEHGSITSAAEALHITGPAVSQHVRKLEREARCRLVEPDGRGIRLTPAGRLLAATARSVAAAVADTERDLANAADRMVGPLRIGAVASAVRTLLPGALRALTANHPRLRPWMRDGEIVDMIPELRARRLDVVVIESWTARPAAMPPGVRVTPLLTEEVRLAVSAHHPLTSAEPVRLSGLGDQVWSACASGTDQHDALVQLLRRHGVEPDVRYHVYDYATMLALVAADLTVTLVPRSGAVAMPGVRYLTCRPAVTRSLAVASAAAGDTPAVRAFTAELARVAEHDLPAWPD